LFGAAKLGGRSDQMHALHNWAWRRC
jgi:hypothetical protein